MNIIEHQNTNLKHGIWGIIMVQCAPTHPQFPPPPQALQFYLQRFCRTASTVTKLSVMFFLPLQSARGPQVASFFICICSLFPFLPVNMFLVVYILNTSFDWSRSCKIISPYIQSNSDYQFLKFSVIFTAFAQTKQKETEFIAWGPAENQPVAESYQVYLIPDHV